MIGIIIGVVGYYILANPKRRQHLIDMFKKEE
jgi:hypothetical protein